MKEVRRQDEVLACVRKKCRDTDSIVRLVGIVEENKRELNKQKGELF